MLIADLFLRYRKHFRVAIFALLLITPSQSLEALNGCPEVATALAKTSSMDVLVKEPNFLPNAVKCLQEITKLIGETDWKTVQAMMPPEITKFIYSPHVLGKAAKAYATGVGLVFMSVYLCYKGTELSEEAKHLALDHEKFREDFDLLRQKQIRINRFIDTEVVRQWKTGNTVQMVKNIEKLIEKLDPSFAKLTKLADQIRDSAKKSESGKAWSVCYGKLFAGACAGAIFTENLWLSVFVCFVSVGEIISSFITHTTCNETLRKSERLRKDAKDLLMEIGNYRTILKIYKTKLEMS